MIITIDRFEGKYAVIELPDGNFINIPNEIFPDAKEGDSFEIKKLINDENKENLFNKMFK